MRYPRHRVPACLTGTWISQNAPRHAPTILNHSHGFKRTMHLLSKLWTSHSVRGQYAMFLDDAEAKFFSSFASRGEIYSGIIVFSGKDRLTRSEEHTSELQ